MAVESQAGPAPARVPFYNDPRVRSLVYQAALIIIVVLLIYGAAQNAIVNLQRARIASGFGFWEQTGAVALLVAPEFLWELLLGIYAAIWGFRRAAPILSGREQ